MGELRIAKAFIRKVTLYAEQHAVDRVATTSEATGLGPSTISASQDVSSTALCIVKLQVRDLQPDVALDCS